MKWIELWILLISFYFFAFAYTYVRTYERIIRYNTRYAHFVLIIIIIILIINYYYSVMKVEPGKAFMFDKTAKKNVELPFGMCVWR